MAAKVVVGRHTDATGTELLKQLHWLPVRLRIQHKVLTLVFQCIQGSAPKYLCALIKQKQTMRSGLRSGRNQHLLAVPTTKNSTFADRSFSIYGPINCGTIYHLTYVMRLTLIVLKRT